MGLDMFLERKTYVKQWDHQAEEDKIHVDVKGGGVAVDNKKITYITEEVIYWRKANAIHQWFVDNCQEGNDNCQPHSVSREQLKELYKVVCSVLKNKDLAEELLPVQSGFFFGTTEYDEWYFEDLECTRKGLKSILDMKDDKGSYYYRSSW